MIRLVVTRVEDDGAVTELGEVRLTETGAVFSHMSTLDGGGVISDLRSRLNDLPRAYAPKPRAGCNHCRVIGALCGLCERDGRRPWPGGRA